MELRNNNRKVIKTLAKVNYRNNRSRNILLIIGIALAVITIFSVFSMITGRVDAQYLINVRNAGNDASTILVDPDEKQIQDVNNLSYIQDTAPEWSLGIQELEGFPAFYVTYIHKKDFDTMYAPAYTDIEGTFPQKENEIMMPMTALHMLGIENPKLGMEIELDISLDENKNDKNTFVLSSYFTEYSELKQSTAFVSKQYANSILKDFDKPTALLIQQDDSVDGYDAEEKLYEDINMTDEAQQFLGGSSMSYNALVDIYGNYNIAIGFTVLIFICIYLLINNVMSISLTRDVKRYGLLKTLGASGRQIRKIVFRQVLRISIIGIAWGTIIGCAFVMLILPGLLADMYLSNFGPAAEMMGFRIEYLILAIAFALIVATVSIMRPTRKISRISPIDAVRYHENTTRRKKRTKKSDTGGKISKLAWRNIFSNKRKAILTMISLTLGLSLALSSVVVVRGLDYTNSIETMDDFDVFNNYDPLAASDAYKDDFHIIDDNMTKELDSIKGIKDMSYNYGTHTLMNLHEKTWDPLMRANKIDLDNSENIDEKRFEMGSVGIISEKQIKQLEEYIEKSNLDVDLKGLKNGTHAVALHFHEFSQSMEKQATDAIDTEFTIRDWDGKKAGTMKLSGYLDMYSKGFPDVGRNAAGTRGMPGVVVSQSAYQKLGLTKRIERVSINVIDEHEPAIKETLTQITDKRSKEVQKLLTDDHGDIGVSMYIKSDDLADAQSYIFTMRLLMYSIAALLLLIGIMNYYNVIATSMITRKKQFAILEAIGMTRKQLQKMLISEGAYYFAIVTTLLVTLGTAGMIILSEVIKEERPYFVYSYPYVEMIIIVTLLLAFCIFLPLKMYKSNVQESAIEQIRHVE